MGRWSKDKYLRYCSPTPKMIIFGVVLLSITGLVKVLEILATIITKELHKDININLSNIITCLLYCSLLIFAVSIIEYLLRSDRRNIKYIIRKALCDTSYGNPLNLREGEVEPIISVAQTDKGFRISVDCMSADFDDVSSLENIISGCLRGKYGNYAVVVERHFI